MSRFYFRQWQVVEEPKTKDDKPVVEEVEDSIAYEDVLRTRKYKDGTMIVILKDGHEVTREVKVMSKTGVPSAKNERVWVQSEIRLVSDDAIRFKKLTEEYDWTKVENVNSEFMEDIMEDKKEGTELDVELLTKDQLESERNIVPDFQNSEITESREEAEEENQKFVDSQRENNN